MRNPMKFTDRSPILSIAGICEALLEKGTFEVYGTTRKVPNANLTRLGVTPVRFQYGSAQSIAEALETSKPDFVIIVTDFANAAKAKGDIEVNHGNLIIDACKAQPSVKHVIFSSVYLASYPDTFNLFRPKVIIEEYLKASGLSFSILRPGGFFENFNDPSTYNPLVKGSLKGLFEGKVQYIAGFDIGRAAVAMLSDYAAWNGKTLNCVAYEGDGNDCAEALTKASGVRCTYKPAMSPTFLWILSFFLPFINEMINAAKVYNPKGLDDIKEFKKVVPDALDAEGFFRRIGKWGNGEKFAT